MTSLHRHKNTAGRWVTAVDGAHAHEDLVGRVDFEALAARVAALETPAPPPVEYPASLQAAINEAIPGATLDVRGRPEPYYEKLLITRPITILGAHVNGRDHAGDPYAIGIDIRSNDVVLRDFIATDWRYCGVMVADCANVLLEDGLVQRIDALRLNASMNAYGVAVTTRGTRQATDVIVRRVTVEDVPDWHGLDTHGGQRIQFLDCTVAGTNRAVFITASMLGSASECEVSRCALSRPTRRRDVLTTYPYNEVGITVVSGCSAYGDGNRFDGWPTGNAIDTQGGSNRFTNSTVVNPQ